MIVGCCDEGDDFKSNKIETSGVSIKVFHFCRYRNKIADISIKKRIDKWIKSQRDVGNTCIEDSI